MADEHSGEHGQALEPAPRPRRLALLQRLLIATGTASLIGALAIGAAITFSGSGGEEEAPPEQPALLHWSDDPGPVYDRPIVTPRPTPMPTPSPAPAPGPPPFANSAFRMVIDSIGVDAPVNPYGLDANQVPEVPLNASEVAWYNWSAQPGTGSNSVFAGHVTWYGLGVFYSLNQLAAGDTIRLRGDDGTELVYTVSDSFMVDEDDPNALSVMAGTDHDMITIITCDGSFYYTGDPVFGGDYTSRRIVQASLTSANVVSTGETPAGG